MRLPITSRRPIRCPFVTAGENGAYRLREGRWWLVPWWAKEMPKAAMFNARSEAVETLNAFKDTVASTRSLIPADGFYEWTRSPAEGGKDPWARLPTRPTTVLVCWTVGLQQEAGHHELHDHHRGGRRADAANPRPPNRCFSIRPSMTPGSIRRRRQSLGKAFYRRTSMTICNSTASAAPSIA
jgi:hypothetical protein